jgi:hypothetical protein
MIYEERYVTVAGKKIVIFQSVNAKTGAISLPSGKPRGGKTRQSEKAKQHTIDTADKQIQKGKLHMLIEKMSPEEITEVTEFIGFIGFIGFLRS